MGSYMSLSVIDHPYGFQWVLWIPMGHYGFLGLYSSLCVLMNFNGFLWVFMGFYGSLLVCISLSGSLWVFMGPYALWAFMHSYKSLWVYKCPYWFIFFLWLLLCFYAALCVLKGFMDPNKSLYVFMYSNRS